MILGPVCVIIGLVAGFVLGLMYARRVKKALSDKIDS